MPLFAVDEAGVVAHRLVGRGDTARPVLMRSPEMEALVLAETNEAGGRLGSQGSSLRRSDLLHGLARRCVSSCPCTSGRPRPSARATETCPPTSRACRHGSVQVRPLGRQLCVPLGRPQRMRATRAPAEEDQRQVQGMGVEGVRRCAVADAETTSAGLLLGEGLGSNRCRNLGGTGANLAGLPGVPAHWCRRAGYRPTY